MPVSITPPPEPQQHGQPAGLRGAPCRLSCMSLGVCLFLSLSLHLGLSFNLPPSPYPSLSLSVSLSISDPLCLSLSAFLYLFSLRLSLSVSIEWNSKVNTIQIKRSQSHSLHRPQHINTQDTVTPMQRQMHTRRSHGNICPSPPSPPPCFQDILNFLWVGRKGCPPPQEWAGSCPRC